MTQEKIMVLITEKLDKLEKSMEEQNKKLELLEELIKSQKVSEAFNVDKAKCIKNFRL